MNHAQWQTLKYAGLYLKVIFFTHGQLYVALSRCGDPSDIFVFIDQSEFYHLRNFLNFCKIHTKTLLIKKYVNKILK